MSGYADYVNIGKYFIFDTPKCQPGTPAADHIARGFVPIYGSTWSTSQSELLPVWFSAGRVNAGRMPAVTIFDYGSGSVLEAIRLDEVRSAPTRKAALQASDGLGAQDNSCRNRLL